MKPLREYLDQLDEIGRRDFMKTAGAALAGAAIGPAGAAEALDIEEKELLVDLAVMYWFSKQLGDRIPQLRALAQQIGDTIHAVADKYGSQGTQALSQGFNRAKATYSEDPAQSFVDWGGDRYARQVLERVNAMLGLKQA